MRVITGSAKGRKLLGPKSDRIRPAIDKVKGAVFNILGEVTGLRVLDLFAGTGAMGIEALSRGASHGTFVDHLQEAVGLIRKNLELCHLAPQATVIKSSIPHQGRCSGVSLKNFDLIFVDPPYDKDQVLPTLQWLADEKYLAPGGIVVVEHSPRETVPQKSAGWVRFDQRKYGQTLVSFLKRTL